MIFYNTLTRKKEEFVPLKEGKINIFVCGLTVYDDAHLGHAKTFTNFDIIVRWLRYSGYEVKYIQSITDIDDKIIKRAAERKVDPIELAREYEKRFLEDLDRIKAKKSVDVFARSHDYIDSMVNQIQLLADKGFAYYLDGDVYYDVSKFKDYTRLSGMKLDELEKHRIEPKEGKINPYDFALWKGAKPGEPSWKVKVKMDGKEMQLDGRPGWHIEDTAITFENFGPQYDLHGGASELIFPHHTNEIAQAEAAFGKVPFVRYWLHSGVFNIKGVKMSKSLKNFVTIRDALERYSPESLRLLYCSTHYRKDVDYSDEAMVEATKRLGYLYAALSSFYNMKEGNSNETDAEVNAITEALKKDFKAAMDDDFNTPLALGSLTIALNKLRAVAETKGAVGKDAKKNALDAVLYYSSVFGILEDRNYKESIPEEAPKLIAEREDLRKQKKFKEADEVRATLKERYKIVIEDSKEGQKWHKE